MATLTSTLLSLSTVLGKFSELGPVKEHLFKAGREVLLATQSFLGFVEDYVGGSASESDRQQMVQGAIQYAQKAIRTLVRQLPRVDEQEYRALHRKVMGSILEVLDAEIRGNARKNTQKSKMKVEVFEAIRNVLVREMYDQDKKGKATIHDDE